MAKVIVIAKKLNRTSWQLAQALRSQQYEVVFLTSQDQDIPETKGVDVMAYFKSWSMAEGLRILPGLFGLQPQILHLVLEEDKLLPAHYVLSTFAKAHPQCVLSTSILNLRRGLHRRNPVRYLVEESDVVTCPNIESLGELRGLRVRSSKQGRGILPPALDLESRFPQHHFIEDEPYLDRQLQEPYLVLPFFESAFDETNPYFLRLKILAQKYRVCLWGSYHHWPLRQRKALAKWMDQSGLSDRWWVSGELSPFGQQRLLKQTQAVLLAGLKLNPSEITEYFAHIIHSHAQLILDSNQSSIHASVWRHGSNCWILNADSLDGDLVRLLAQDLKLPETVSEKLAHERHLIDNPFNELSRLYNKALDRLNHGGRHRHV